MRDMFRRIICSTRKESFEVLLRANAGWNVETGIRTGICSSKMLIQLPPASSSPMRSNR